MNGHETFTDVHKKFREVTVELIPNGGTNSMDPGLISRFSIPEVSVSPVLFLQMSFVCQLCFGEGSYFYQASPQFSGNGSSSLSVTGSAYRCSRLQGS